MRTLNDVLVDYPGAETFRFGDSEALCIELLALARAGRKTATCGSLAQFLDEGEAMPVAGRYDIVLNWDGTPALVIRTVAVSVQRFCDVGKDFALAEGEDETLASWQSGHRQYFTRNGGWRPDMELVCERFEMVQDLAT